MAEAKMAFLAAQRTSHAASQRRRCRLASVEKNANFVVAVQRHGELDHDWSEAIATSAAERRANILASNAGDYRPIDLVWSNTAASVFVGTAAAALSSQQLAQHGITRVVNCTVNDYDYPLGVTWMRLPVASLQQGLSDSQVADCFAQCFAFIDEAVRMGGSTLIHCVSGMHRGGTVGVAYLMHACSLDAASALKAIRVHRSIVAPQDIPALWELLLSYERARAALTLKAQSQA